MNINHGVWGGDDGKVSVTTIVTAAGSVVNPGVDARREAVDAQLVHLLAQLRELPAPAAALGVEELRRELGAAEPDRVRLHRLLGGVADAIGAIGPAGRLMTRFLDIDQAIRALF